MSEANRRASAPFRLRAYVWTLMAFWTTAIGITLTWELFDERNQARDVARAQARGTCIRNESILRWYSALGGLYAPVSKDTRPSPELADLPDRDITMPAGRRLTLVDPVDMMRQMREISHEESDLHARLTASKRTHPENAPDSWETEALEALEHGEAEVSSVSPMSRESYMRVIRPLVLEQSCVKCHPEQADRMGQVYGGFSVSLPMAVVWPNERDEMARRVFGYGSMWLLGMVGISFGSRILQRQIEQRRQAEQLLQARDAQMQAAQQIQRHLLPAAPPLLPGFDIAGATCPAEFTSGDYYDYIAMRDGSIALVIADVCGHGLGPALLMASTQAFLRSSTEIQDDLGEILGRVNRCLLDVAERDRFVTLFLGRLDPRTRTLTYSSAGHPTGYVLDPSGAVKIQLESTAIPLAIEPDAKFSLGSVVPLESGDTVVLLTDGILEAQSPAGEPFEVERVLQTVRAARGAKAAEIIARLLQAVRAFCGSEKPIDDITAVVIRVEAAP